MLITAIEATIVVVVALALGQGSTIVVGGLVAGAVALMVVTRPTLALLSLPILYALPSTLTFAAARPRDLVTGCLGLVLLQWVRREGWSRDIVFVLGATFLLLILQVASALSYLTVPGETASIAELIACLIALASGTYLGASGELHRTVQVVSLVLAGVAVATLVTWVHNHGSLPPDLAFAATERASTIFGNPNFLGTLLAIGAVLVVAPRAGSRPRPAQLVGFLLLALGVIASGSRGALLVLAAGIMAILFILRGRRALVVALAIVLPVAIYGVLALTSARVTGALAAGGSGATVEDSPTLRLEVARLALSLTMSHPLAGVGYAQFPAYSERDPKVGIALNTHNAYLQIGAESGLLAFLLTLSTFAYCLTRGVQVARREGSASSVGAAAALIAFAVALGTCNGLGSAQFAVPAMLLGGALVGEWNRLQTAKTRAPDCGGIATAPLPLGSIANHPAGSL